ncbi:MAG: hypothetical protein ACTSRW_17730, partial [Candidatus Helarchaeota archaeon]
MNLAKKQAKALLRTWVQELISMLERVKVNQIKSHSELKCRFDTVSKLFAASLRCCSASSTPFLFPEQLKEVLHLFHTLALIIKKTYPYFESDGEEMVNQAYREALNGEPPSPAKELIEFIVQRLRNPLPQGRELGEQGSPEQLSRQIHEQLGYLLPLYYVKNLQGKIEELIFSQSHPKSTKDVDFLPEKAWESLEYDLFVYRLFWYTNQVLKREGYIFLDRGVWRRKKTILEGCRKLRNHLFSIFDSTRTTSIALEDAKRAFFFLEEVFCNAEMLSPANLLAIIFDYLDTWAFTSDKEAPEEVSEEYRSDFQGLLEDSTKVFVGQREDDTLHTYKVGLRVPESLLQEQNKLIIESEVLNHIRKQLRGAPSQLMSGKISKASQIVVNSYNEASDKYNLRRIRNAIKQLHWKNPILNSNSFKRTQVPSFVHPEAPTIQEISLTDYQNLANMSLKMLCKHLNEQVLHEVYNVPKVKQDFIDLAFRHSQRAGKRYTLNQIQSRFEIALSNITGIHSNIGRTAFYQLGMAMKAYFSLREKVEFVRHRLDPSLPSNADFSGEIPILLTFYSIPNNLRKYLARSWGVDAQWVRNTLVGWRRKIDGLLPIEFQIEPLTNRFLQIADFFKRFAGNERDGKVIGRLQKKQILHLLPNKNIDLSPLLPKNLISNYHSLQNRLKGVPNVLNSHLHSITLREFLASGNELISQVQSNQGLFPKDSQSYKNCQTFINKINYILKEANRPELKELLKNYIIGNRFTRAVAHLLEGGSKYTRLFTALRGIIALTLARKVERKAHPNDAEFLVNKPMPSKSTSVTEIFRNGAPIWLGLPIYAPSQERQFQEVVRGTRNTVARKGIFWFQLIPSKKIIECVRRGAKVIDLRLNIPQGPTNKIVADIVLSSSEPNAFQHRGQFLNARDTEFNHPKLPIDDFLGVDFNR